MAFPGTMSHKPKYPHTDRDVPIHMLIYCKFALWFTRVSLNELPVHVGICQWRGQSIKDVYGSAPGMAVSSILGMI